MYNNSGHTSTFQNDIKSTSHTAIKIYNPARPPLKEQLAMLEKKINNPKHWCKLSKEELKALDKIIKLTRFNKEFKDKFYTYSFVKLDYQICSKNINMFLSGFKGIMNQLVSEKICDYFKNIGNITIILYDCQEAGELSKVIGILKQLDVHNEKIKHDIEYIIKTLSFFKHSRYEDYYIAPCICFFYYETIETIYNIICFSPDKDLNLVKENLEQYIEGLKMSSNYFTKEYIHESIDYVVNLMDSIGQKQDALNIISKYRLDKYY